MWCNAVRSLYFFGCESTHSVDLWTLFAFLLCHHSFDVVLIFCDDRHGLTNNRDRNTRKASAVVFY